jgi:hypothetical protein
MSGPYLPVRTVGGTVAIGICYRCQMKHYLGDLKQDPNTKAWCCKDCTDILDPWRLPARKTEDLRVQHPRLDEELV